jgi:hypothetical protein
MGKKPSTSGHRPSRGGTSSTGPKGIVPSYERKPLPTKIEEKYKIVPADKLKK